MARDNLIDPSGWFDDLDPSSSDDGIIDPSGWFDDEPDAGLESRSTRQRWADRGVALPMDPPDHAPQVENEPITTQPQMSPAFQPAGPELFPQSPASFDQLTPENRQAIADQTVGGGPYLFEGDGYGQPTIGETIARGDPVAPEGIGQMFLGTALGMGGGTAQSVEDLIRSSNKGLSSEDIPAMRERITELRGQGLDEQADEIQGLLEADRLFGLGPGMRMSADAVGFVGDWLTGKADKAFERVEQARPEGMVGGYTYDVGLGLAQTAIPIMTTLLSRGRNVWQKADDGYRAFAAQIASLEYGRAREDGKEPLQAIDHALRQTTYEVGPEMAFGVFDRLLAPGMLNRLKQGLAEGASEAVTGIAQEYDQFMQSADPMEWGSIAYQGAVGAGMGLLMGGSGQTPTKPPAPSNPVSGYVDTFNQLPQSLQFSLTSPEFTQDLDLDVRVMAGVSPDLAAGFNAARVDVGDMADGGESILEAAESATQRERVFDERQQQESQQRAQETDIAYRQRQEQEQLQRDEQAAQAAGEPTPNRALAQAMEEARQGREERWAPKPSEAQPAEGVSLDEQIRRLEQEVETDETDLAPDILETEEAQPIFRADGEPYRTRQAARARMAREGLQGDVVEMDGGFAILPGGERRVDAETRRKIEEIPEEELTREEAVELARQYRREARTDELSGVQNTKAYNEAEQTAPAPVKVAIDVDGLGWVNDNVGHEAGDDYIREVGRILTGSGLEVYRVGGDEFIIRGQPGVEAEAEAVRESLAQARLEFETPDGETIIVNGAQISMGVGTTRKEADERLYEDKAQRAETGKRARTKGARPPHIDVQAPDRAAEGTAEGQPAEADRDAGQRTAPREEGQEVSGGQSRRQSPAEAAIEPTGNTIQGVRSRIPGWMNPMLESGLVEIVQSTNDVPGRLPPDIAGVWLGEKIYLIADNIDPYQEVGLVFHEVGVHHGLKKLIGQERYDRLVRQMRRQVGRGGTENASRSDQQVYDAYQRALADPSIETEADLFEETIAYLAEAGADASLLDRIIAAIREGLRQVGLGILAENMGAAEIAQLARGSTRKVARAEQAKTARQRARRPEPARASFSRRQQTETPEFKRWFGDSVVTNENGEPLVAYRGEHGSGDGANMQTRIGSISFGSREAANLYATSPNDRRDTADAPRVIPAYLKIENPIVNDQSDPFIDMKVLADALSRERANEIAVELEDHLNNTDNWSEVRDELDVASVREAIEKDPEVIDRLYVDIYPVLDNPGIVADLKAAGFDGAIYEGAGDTSGETEYRVFDQRQIKSSTGNVGTFDPANPDIRYSRRKTETPQFREWFDDSKVVDESGDPVVLYHGTPNEFTDFDMERVGQTSGNEGYWGSGIYMSASRNLAEGFGDNVMGLYAKLENPYVIKEGDLEGIADRIADLKGWTSDEARAIRESEISPGLIAGGRRMTEVFQENGYDGVVVHGWQFGEGGTIQDVDFLEVIAFSGDQVKSTSDIRHSRRQAGTMPMSTRIPSEPQAQKNPALDSLENLLSIDYNTLKEAEKALQKNVNLLYQTIPVQPLTGKGSRTPAVRVEHVLDFEQNNLEFLHDLMPEEWRNRARLWYDGARLTTEAWADRYGVTESQAGAMIAVLSPQKGWFENMSMAERILDITSTQQDYAWDAEMDTVAERISDSQPEILERARGRTLSELMNDPPAAARWVRIYDQAHNSPAFRVLTPEGGAADWVMTAAGNKASMRWGSYSAVAKAIALVNDGSAENIHYQLGSEHKVRSFYNNLIDPNSDRGTVTIDTHAVAAASLLPLSAASAQVAHAFGSTPAKEFKIAGAASSAQTGMRGTYPIHKEAYDRAASAKGVLPREMQSITWEAVRGFYPDTMKRSAKKRAQINEIWERHRTGKISQGEAQQELKKAAGGITPPAWVDVPYNDVPSRTYEGDAQAAMDARPAPAADQRTGLEAPAVSFEVAPDPNNQDLTERWNSLAEDIKLAISERVANEIVPGALKELGLDGQVQMDLGGYLGATNPSLSIEVDRPGATIRLAKLLGYALSQDSMMAVADQPFLGGQKTGAVSIVLPEGYSAKQVEEIYDRLWEIEVNGERVVSGHTTRNGLMAILNFGDTVSTPRLAKLVYNRLNGEFEVKTHDVHAAFVDNTEYGYGEEEGTTADREAGAATGRSPVQRRARDLRRDAQAALERELDAARPEKFSRRVTGRPGAAPADGRPRAEDARTGRFAAGRNGRVDTTGVHFSSEPRTTLDGRYYGTGMTGSERPRVMSATDQRLKERVYTYINQGTGIRPEQNVGIVPHRVQLNNLYDLSADPLGFRTTHAGNMNNIESAVLDAGFDGVLVRDSMDGMSTSVILGQASHEVAAEPIDDYNTAPVVQEQQVTPADELYEQIKNLPYAPTGQVAGARWRELLEQNSPDLASELGDLGVLAKLGDKTYYYPDKVAALARDALRDRQPKYSRRDRTVINAAERFAERGNTERGRRRLDKLAMIWRWDIITQDMTRATVYDDPIGDRDQGSLQEVWFDSMDRMIPGWIEQERVARDETYSEVVDRFRREVQQEVGQDVSIDDLARYAMAFSGERKQFLDEVMASDLPASVKRQAQSLVEASLPANDIRYSRRQPTFFSPVERAVQGIQQNKAQPQQWLGMIRKQPGVKKEELDWLGLEQWLGEQEGAVTRDQVLDFVRQNMVQVDEVLLSESNAAPKITSTEAAVQNFPGEVRALEIEGIEVEIREIDYGDGTTAYAAEFITEEGETLSALELEPYVSDSVYDAAAVIEGAVVDENQGITEEGTVFNQPDLVVPGGRNYQELLLTLPVEDDGQQKFILERDEAYAQFGGWVVREPRTRNIHVLRAQTREEAEAEMRDIQRRRGENAAGGYRSTHFDQPNILAHVRFNERTDADGKRVLFIEEVQSDWHQAGRKAGYRLSGKERAKAKKRLEQVRREILDSQKGGRSRSELEALRDERNELSDLLLEDPIGAPPDAPFKQSWPMLAMKRMIRYASENGFDRIAWTPGDVQADRYDLSRQVEEIEVVPGRNAGDRIVNITLLSEDLADTGMEPLEVTVNKDGVVTNGGGHFEAGKGLDEVVGKEMAEKIMAGEGEPSTTDDDIRLFRGADLKIGGEGMRGFYDRMLKNEVGKYVKKMGARVGTTNIATAAAGKKPFFLISGDGGVVDSYTTRQEAEEAIEDYLHFSPNQRYFVQDNLEGAHRLEAWSVDITPKMRESAMEGQPMFSRRRSSRRADESLPGEISFDVSFDAAAPADAGGTGGVRAQDTVPQPPPAGKEGFSNWAYMGKDSDGRAILVGTAHPSLKEKNALHRFWRRWLTKEGQLTKEAFARHIEADGIKNVEEVTTQFLSHAFTKAARKANKKRFFNSIPAEERRKMNDYLAGEEVDGLSAEVRDTLDEMRGHLDQLSFQLQKMLIDEMRFASEALTAEDRQTFLDNLVPAASGDKAAMKAIAELPNLGGYLSGKLRTLQTIEGNKGSYLHRSYRVFDDPKWKPSDEVMDRARAFIREQVDRDPEMVDATDAQKDNRVDGIISSILGTRAGGMLGFLSSSQLGEKDRSVLKKRKQIAPEIRELMGEYHDPRTNFATSATKMAYMLANHHFLKKVREDGLGVYLSKKQQGVMGSEISSWGDQDAMAPLAGLYATEEFAEALRQHVESNVPEGWVRQLYMVNAGVKYGKTVLSPTTAMRNLISASMFTVMNGHMGYHNALLAAKVTFADLATSNRAKMEYLQKLVRMGVLHDNPRAREMMDAMQDVADMDTTKGGVVSRGTKSVLNAATRFYRFGDDFWKVIGFESEKARLIRSGMDADAAETMAADRIRNGYPTYSMVPESIRMLRKFPLVGTFVSFPWEMIRTTSHQFRFLKEDVAAGRTRAVASRAVGMLVAAGLADALRMASMAMLGIGDDEDEAIRELAAPWQKNARLMYLPPDKEGRLRYLDLTHLDPYSYLKLPVYATANGNNRGAEEKAVEAVTEFLMPFLGTEITFQAVGEWWFNAKMDNGAPVYDRNSTRWEQGKQVAEHFVQNLAPGVVNNVHRTLMAFNKRMTSYGKPYSLTDEGLAWAGFRLTTADTQTSLKFRSFDFDEKKSDAGRPTYRVLRNFNPQSESDIRQAVNVTHQVWTDAFDDMHNAITAARISGLSDREIASTLDGAGVAKKYIPRLMRGETPFWQPSNISIRNAAESVTQGRVSIPESEFEERLKIMQDELERIRRSREENG